MWPTEEATRHLEGLAELRGIEIIWTDDPPSAHPGYLMVWVNRPTNAVRYLSALHEFGHCLEPRAVKLWEYCSQRERDHAPEHQANVRMESLAWTWAFAACRPHLAELVRERDWHTVLGAWLSYGKHLALQPSV